MTESGTKTYQELEDENYELKRQKERLIYLLEEATDWDWLEAKEEAEENNSKTLSVEPMQEILDELRQIKNEN